MKERSSIVSEMRENFLLLQMMLACQDQFLQLLGDEWPAFRTRLLEVLDRLSKAKNDTEMLEAVDDIIKECLATSAANLIRELLQKAASGSGQVDHTTRSTRVTNPTTGQARDIDITSAGATGTGDVTSEDVAAISTMLADQLQPMAPPTGVTMRRAPMRVIERRINAWIEERSDSDEPLRLAETYTLNCMVGQSIAANLIRGPEALVPASDVGESGLDIDWVITSDTVELTALTPEMTVFSLDGGSGITWEAKFSLHIPKEGDSATRSLKITPRAVEGIALNVMIYARTELYREFKLALAVEKGQAVMGAAADAGYSAVVTVNDECVYVPLAHLGLRTAQKWTTPPGAISIAVLGPDKVYVRGDAGVHYVEGISLWKGAKAKVAGLIDNIRQSAEKLRARAEEYLNNINPDDLSERLQNFKPQSNWIAFRDDADQPHQQKWQNVAVSQELRDLAYDGKSMYEAFFPLGSELRAWFDGLSPGQRINITWQEASGAEWIPHVPWGLMYQQPLPELGAPLDPQGFWGLRYRISYSAYAVGAGSKALGRVDDAYGMHLLYWGDQPQDITGIEARWQQQQWSGWKNQNFLPLTLANAKAILLQHLDVPTPNPTTVLYLFCQCSVGDGNDPVLRFGNTIQPADVVRRTELGSNFLVDRPLVFANACTTATADPYIANELEASFFRRGCRAYIGTESKVPIRLASRFASIFFYFFYRKVDAKPMAAGEAIAQARLFLWTQYKNIGGLYYTYVNQYELFMAHDKEVFALRD